MRKIMDLYANFWLTLIYAHTPTEDKHDAVKDIFYAKLEDICDKCPAHDAKIVLGREGIFDPTVGQYSLYENTTSNGIILPQRLTW